MRRDEIHMRINYINLRVRNRETYRRRDVAVAIGRDRARGRHDRVFGRAVIVYDLERQIFRGVMMKLVTASLYYAQVIAFRPVEREHYLCERRRQKCYS